MLTSLVFDRAKLEAEQDRLVRGYLSAGTRTIATVTRAAEKSLEAATRSAVPGKLWRAWQSETYPKDGKSAARAPAGVISLRGGVRTRGAIAYFTTPGIVRSQTEGGFLAIPTKAAGSRGRARNLTPGEWERRHGVRLRYVYRRGRPSLLVLDEGVLSGKKQIARRNSEKRRATGRGNTTIVIFVLMPMLAHANRFSVEALVGKSASEILSVFQTEAGKVA